MREMEEVMAGIDAYVGGDDLTLTNLTGHPTVVIPDGTREKAPASSPARSRSPASSSAKPTCSPWPTPTNKPADAHLHRPPLEKLLEAKAK